MHRITGITLSTIFIIKEGDMKKVPDKLFRLEHGIVVLGECCLLSGYFSFLSPIYRYE